MNRPKPLLAALAAATTGNTALDRSGGLTLINHYREHEKDPSGVSRPPPRPQGMRDAKRQNSKRRPARDVTEISVVWADAGSTSEAEARELLDQGLRILARLAVRAYLRQEASLPASDSGEQSLDNPSAD